VKQSEANDIVQMFFNKKLKEYAKDNADKYSEYYEILNTVIYTVEP
jgi:hypothetical protein